MGKPSQEAIAEARWQAFDTIGQTADLMASYARSIGEAAYRRDELELAVHIRQVIDCARSMARVYREAELGKRDSPAGDGADQRAGDGVAGSGSQ